MSRDYEDDYEDDRGRGRKRGGEKGPLDGMFRDTSMPVLVIFAICCGGIALILSIIAFATAKDPEAKSKAQTVMIISIIMSVIGVIANIVAMSMQGGRGF